MIQKKVDEVDKVDKVDEGWWGWWGLMRLIRVDEVDEVDSHSLEKKNNRFIPERMNINPHQPSSTLINLQTQQTPQKWRKYFCEVIK